MPGLASGEALLLMVFLFSLCFGYLGASNPPLKSGPMIMFVNMAGISNEQSFSFQGPVDGGMMTILAGLIVAITYMFFRPLKPERLTLVWMKRFGRGCLSFAESIGSSKDPSARAHDRETALRSLILPAPENLRANAAGLKDNSNSASFDETIQQLCDSLQSTADRLKGFELSITDVRRRDEIAQRAYHAINTRLKHSLSTPRAA